MPDRRMLLRAAAAGALLAPFRRPPPADGAHGRDDPRQPQLRPPRKRDGRRLSHLGGAASGGAPRPPVAFLLDPHDHFGRRPASSARSPASATSRRWRWSASAILRTTCRQSSCAGWRNYTPVADSAHEALVGTLLGPGGARAHRRRRGIPALHRCRPQAGDRRALSRRSRSLGADRPFAGRPAGAARAALRAGALLALCAHQPADPVGREAILARESGYAARHRDLRARLFLAAGGEEPAWITSSACPGDARDRPALSASLGDPDPLEQLRRFHAALGRAGAIRGWRRRSTSSRARAMRR